MKNRINKKNESDLPNLNSLNECTLNAENVRQELKELEIEESVFIKDQRLKEANA